VYRNIVRPLLFRADPEWIHDGSIVKSINGGLERDGFHRVTDAVGADT
jgi:hypothetical protein